MSVGRGKNTSDMGTPAADTATRPVTFKISEADILRLQEIAQADERTVSAVLRLAVRYYIEGRQAA